MTLHLPDDLLWLGFTSTGGFAAAIALAVALGGLVLVFAGYPVLLWLRGLVGKEPERASHRDAKLPTVSLLVAVRNGESGIAAKLDNALALDYPEDRLEIVISDDGSEDDTTAIVERFVQDPRHAGRIRLLTTQQHDGKAAALNRAAPECRGEIIVFTDADALLEPRALEALVRPFAEAKIGGVCGRRVIGEDTASLEASQSDYIAADSALKLLESRHGSITSNDGKLYAIRRRLFRPIDPEATDDLFTCLGVVDQGYRFVFEPAARARVRVPSRNGGHEVGRRRRIVARSLRGIYLHRRVLNPFRTGLFGLGLLINKVMRRLIPVFLLMILLASAVLARGHVTARIFLGLQIAFYALAACYPLVAPLMRERRTLRRLFQAPFYFCLGNYGMFLGLVSFLTGQRVSRWNPRKSDEPGPLSERSVSDRSVSGAGAPPC